MSKPLIVILSLAAIGIGVILGMSIWRNLLPPEPQLPEFLSRVQVPEKERSAQKAIEDFQLRRRRILTAKRTEEIKEEKLSIPEAPEFTIYEEELSAAAQFEIIGEENELLLFPGGREEWEKLPHVSSLSEKEKEEYLKSLGLAEERTENFIPGDIGRE